MNRYYFARGISVTYSISMLFALVLVFKYESSLTLETEVLVWMLFRPTDHPLTYGTIYRLIQHCAWARYTRL